MNPEIISNITLFSVDTLHDPVVAFTIADAKIYWYGILTTIGYFVAIVTYLLTLNFRYKVSTEPGFYFVFLAIPVIIFGARFWSCTIGDARWNEFFNFRTGGLAVQGGVVFGALAGIIFFPLILLKKRFHKRVSIDGNIYVIKPSVWIYADAIIPTILLGQAIGRWGNFFNGEIFGSAVGLADVDNSLNWLKVLMPSVYEGMISTHPIGNDPANTIYQPLFLYESFANIMLFITIYILLPITRKIRIGVISGCYFLGYGIIRMITETLRNSAFRFTSTYIMNSFLLIIGIILICYCQFISYRLREFKVWIFIWDFLNSNKRQLMKNKKESSLSNKGYWNHDYMKRYIKKDSQIYYYDWR